MVFAYLLVLVISFVLQIPVTLLGSAVIQDTWNTFVVPMGVPSMSLGNAFGVGVVASIFLAGVQTRIKDDKEIEALVAETSAIQVVIEAFLLFSKFAIKRCGWLLFIWGFVHLVGSILFSLGLV